MHCRRSVRVMRLKVTSDFLYYVSKESEDNSIQFLLLYNRSKVRKIQQYNAHLYSVRVHAASLAIQIQFLLIENTSRYCCSFWYELGNEPSRGEKRQHFHVQNNFLHMCCFLCVQLVYLECRGSERCVRCTMQYGTTRYQDDNSLLQGMK